MQHRFTINSSLAVLSLITILSSCTGQISGSDQEPVAGDESPTAPAGTAPPGSTITPPVATLPDAGPVDNAPPVTVQPDAGPVDTIPPVTPQPDAGPVDNTPPVVGTNPAPMVRLSFVESNADIINPERGFYVGMNLAASSGAAQARAGGYSLAIAEVRLDAYRDRPIDAALLAQLDAGFATVRAAGIKVVLRFMYNAAFDADAPRSVILGHIAQLKPLLQRNADVIAVMQAGFIGAWGEWHTSTNGLDNAGDRGAILTAILNALPVSRAVQVRTPMHKEAFAGAPVSGAEAFNGSNAARIGHHNDCFLASSSDFGTYASPVSQWESYVSQDTRFTPMGGETCAVSARTDCGPAVAEMSNNHWSYLNREYHQDVLAGWETQGCGDDIRRHLGYRLVLKQAVHSATVAPGGVLALSLDIANTGFAAPFNERPVYVVLSGGGARRVARLNAVDVRRWQQGQTASIAVKLRVPANAAPGSYKIALWMPDDATALRDDSRYAIRLANDGMFDATTGDNVISGALVVDAVAPGTVDPLAHDFVAIP